MKEKLPAFVPSYFSGLFARRFDKLRRYQDIAPLVEAIESVSPLKEKKVIELGAGTGAMTEALAARAASVLACDRSPQMLALARRNLQRRGLSNVCFVLSDYRDLSLAENSADLAIAAFALDSVLYDSPESDWRRRIDQIVFRMRRAVKYGGAAIIIATPHAGRDLCGHLEQGHGFLRRYFKTRWRFPSRRIARAAVRLFFGERVWRDYRPHWPKALVTLAGLWWLRAA